MKSTSSITVYLDSQDYSRMSDPRTRTAQLDQVRSELHRYATSGEIQFVYSGTIISEMTPLKAEHAHIASYKADLLVELCGNSTLVAFDRLADMEISRLINKDIPPVNAISEDGTWFPVISPDISPTRCLDMKRLLAKTMQEEGRTRIERRAIMRKGFKRNNPTAAFRASLAVQDGRQQMDALLASYPMRPEDAKVWAQYSLGKATEMQLNNALIASLKDPRWMMRWFSTKHELASPIIEWVRNPAREIGDVMRKMADHAKSWAQMVEIHNFDSKPDILTPKGWNALQEKQILAVVLKLTERRFPDHSGDISNGCIESSCPGIVAMIRSFYSALWNSVGGSRSESPSDSQFVDSLHAMYAPYVNVFRADRYMAPHIRKQVENYGTHVVSKLEDVPNVLSRMLSQRQAGPGR